MTRLCLDKHPCPTETIDWIPHRSQLHFGIDMLMKSIMQHTWSCPTCSHLGIPLGGAILVLCTNTTEWVQLLLFITILLETYWYKDSIVRITFFDDETFVVSRCFHSMFVLKCFERFGRELTEVENFPTCMANKQCTTSVAMLFSHIGIRKLTRNRWDIMASGNTVPTLSVSTLQDFLPMNTIYLFDECGDLNRWPRFRLWDPRCM